VDVELLVATAISVLNPVVILAVPLSHHHQRRNKSAGNAHTLSLARRYNPDPNLIPHDQFLSIKNVTRVDLQTR
jgi:hypothetical protein